MATERKRKFAGKKKLKKPRREKISPERRESVITVVRKIAAPLCEAENLELVSVDYLQEAYDTIIRLCIDKPGGITLEDCSNVSMQLSDLLDIELTIDTGYRLEVSSPGI